MFQKHEHAHRSHAIAIIRDVVEIVAIIAAGFWAFYVFIYENRIVPLQYEPNVNFTAQLQKVSEHNGLIGIRMDTEIRNIGTVRAHFLGLATAVMGQRIEARSFAGPVVFHSNETYAPYFHASKPVPVYETGFVTLLGDPRVSQDLPLEPGGDERNQTIFYVPAGRFDRLRVYIIGRFTRHDEKTIPTSMYTNSTGLPAFRGSGDDLRNFATYVTSLDLNAR